MSDPDDPNDDEANAPPPPASHGVPAPAGGRSRRASLWLSIVAVALALVVVAGLVASRVSVNYYVLTPGDATPVSKYIEVPSSDNHPVTGTILLTDVFVTSLNALSYLRYKFLDSNNEIVPGPELLGPTPNENQYLDQGYIQMAQAQDNATASALRRLGYVVTSTHAGTLVYGVEPRSPATRSLKVGQVITAVNTTPTPTACDLVRTLHGMTPGTTVSLTVEQNSISNSGQIVPGPTVSEPMRLAAPPRGLSDSGCGLSGGPTAYMGIDPQTQLDWHFPVAVTVHTQDIGGPSAGLAMTLGIMDKLSTGRLTGDRVVAATGEIDQYGNVGDVGGVAEKTVAVERAGATVFFVPSVELGVARSKAGPQLHVYGVKNLNQTLRILERLGGRVPNKPVPAQAAP